MHYLVYSTVMEKSSKIQSKLVIKLLLHFWYFDNLYTKMVFFRANFFLNF